MTVPQALLLFAILWLLAVATAWLVVVPFLARLVDGDPYNGFLWCLVRVYTRMWHRPTYLGLEHVPPDAASIDRGLIVVSNHTGAVDPLLIQARCHFFVKWMMAADMISPALGFLWKQDPIIPVGRDGRDSGPLRAAIRKVRGGGVVGIFPEGRITTPPREVRPFLPGVGLLIARTRAPVLLAWVSGTPDTNKLGEAMATRSRSRVVFLEPVTYPEGTDPATITDDLRNRIAGISGWPLNDEMIPPGGPREAGEAS
jgi:1-acyl-sn-glycerol-3-phosphate acyltransferase